MDEAKTYEQLQGVFDDVFMEPVVVTPTLTARDVEEWDSLTHVSLVLAIERAFGIRFHVGEVESAQNVGDLVGLIRKRSGG
ncbi:MAG TPA: acyl carrier protein [Fimbriimonadaceae bacterium]|nr:acyl carrier protein [Fimbriimonadaceae bacterium]